MRGFRGVLLAAAVAVVSAGAPAVRAEPPAAAVRDVVVVEVDAGSSGVDAARLRKAIGDELGADAVAPDDDSAGGARGTLTVNVDRAARSLVVSYREKGAPIVRRMDLPPDSEATTRAAVLLAGNLARDEASELAEMLRRRAPAQTSATGPLAPEDLVGDAQAEGDPESERDLELMDRVLASYSGHRRAIREAAYWTVFGTGLAMEGVGLALTFAGPTHDNATRAGSVLASTGLGLFLVGAPFAPNERLDDLLTYYREDRVSGRPPSLVRQDLEFKWRRAAGKERVLRIFLGAIDLLCVAGLGVSEALLHPSGASWSPELSFGDVWAVGLGSAALGASIVLLSGPGPIERSLRSYEHETGRRVGSAPNALPVLSFAVGRGIAGLTGRF